MEIGNYCLIDFCFLVFNLKLAETIFDVLRVEMVWIAFSCWIWVELCNRVTVSLSIIVDFWIFSYTWTYFWLADSGNDLRSSWVKVFWFICLDWNCFSGLLFHFSGLETGQKELLLIACYYRCWFFLFLFHWSPGTYSWTFIMMFGLKLKKNENWSLITSTCSDWFSFILCKPHGFDIINVL